ncbi:hypothetical protein TWF696_005062 [Orbilia brochopaga]|uniref:Uncharacterized protein n=1 Tax=Orbilia brochopaga TaxID=3140254 RepID=A0AAV9V2C8_9PEZI
MRQKAAERYSDEDRETVWNRIEAARIKAERRMKGIRTPEEDTTGDPKDKDERALQSVSLEEPEGPRPRPIKRQRCTGFIEVEEFDPCMAELR